jgi:uncharacterized protein
MNGSPPAWNALTYALMYRNWASRSAMPAFDGLGVALQVVPGRLQHPTHRHRTDGARLGFVNAGSKWDRCRDTERVVGWKRQRRQHGEMPMSASDNKTATQAAYQAFANADLDGAMQDTADDIEWIVPGNSTISGTYRGKDEGRQLFVTLAGKSFRTEPEHFVADGDHVVVLTRVTADGQSSDQAAVLTFRGTRTLS